MDLASCRLTLPILTFPDPRRYLIPKVPSIKKRPWIMALDEEDALVIALDEEEAFMMALD